MKNLLENMPPPPLVITSDKVNLKFIEIIPGVPEKGYVPYYHYEIDPLNNIKVGHINFRIGDTDHVKYCAGHIGYEIMPEFRGNCYSYFACLSIRPFVKSVYESVIMTVSPFNLPSKRIIEKLGCDFIDEINISPNEAAYQKGERLKRRYRWYP